MADETKKETKWWKKHYLVTMKTRLFTDIRKFVQFKNGRGILDMECFTRAKSHWVASDDKGNTIPSPNYPHWRLQHYVEYFERAGCTVEPITATAAAELRSELEAEPVMSPGDLEPKSAPEPATEPADDDAGKETPATDDAAGTEKTFVCGKCKAKFDAVDVGVSPIECPKCGKKAAKVKKGAK